MKIALIGYGKMGQRVEAIASQRGHEICCRINSKTNPRDLTSLLEPADVCINFSLAPGLLDMIHLVAQSSKNMVVGTTGWYDQLDQAKQIIEKCKTGFLYAPNFAIGVHLFLKLVEEAAQLIDAWEDYDACVLEAHHNQKADHPSGTAQAMAQKLLKHIRRKNKIVMNINERPIADDEVHIASLRCGHIPGTHSLLIDSPVDSLTVMHTARNRDGFALGAVKASEWLYGKEGFYTLEDMIRSKNV